MFKMCDIVSTNMLIVLLFSNLSTNFLVCVLSEKHRTHGIAIY
jgi:hypothetical protein